MSNFQSLKLATVSLMGLSKDALHVHLGLLAFFAPVLLLRLPMHSPWPWLTALLAAVLGEALDAFDDLRSLGYWRTDASLHDLLNTVFWPTALFVLARCSKRRHSAR